MHVDKSGSYLEDCEIHDDKVAPHASDPVSLHTFLSHTKLLAYSRNCRIGTRQETLDT